MLKISARFTKFGLLIFNIFFPKKCVICSKYGSFLCINCYKKIEPRLTGLCPECGKISSNCRYCPACKRKNGYKIDGLIYSVVYQDKPVKKLIYSLKYLGYTQVADIIALIMSQTLKHMRQTNITLVPIPLSTQKLNIRGFNQAKLIATGIKNFINCETVDLLVRSKNTKSQASLKRIERRENIKDAFKLAKNQQIPKVVYLVDDVFTTGATLNEAAVVLKKAGVKKVYGLTFAREPLQMKN
jgi:competence protein ComFC